jgi:CHAT domain-containing protein
MALLLICAPVHAADQFTLLFVHRREDPQGSPAERERTPRPTLELRKSADQERRPEQRPSEPPRGTVLVDFFQLREFGVAEDGKDGNGRLSYAACLAWRSGGDRTFLETRRLPLGSVADMDKLIRDWRTKVQAGHIDDRLDRALRKALWDPLAKKLPEKTSRLVLVPDGNLCLVPFEAIRLEDGKYLVERLEIGYGDGRDFRRRTLPAKKPHRAVIVADPDFDAGGNAVGPRAKREKTSGPDLRGINKADPKARFESLPGFAREATAAAQILKANGNWKLKLLQGSAASEDAVLALREPRLLYFITHAYFQGDANQGQPVIAGGRGTDTQGWGGLALAGANQGDARARKGLSHGLLSWAAVSGMDLRSTDLVILSAGDSGLGVMASGEGLLGLGRAFELAGAQTVIAALWKVPDRQTEKLMTSFLKSWLAGAGKARALRGAQLELIRDLRRSTDARLRKAPPLYWAGFICRGDPN